MGTRHFFGLLVASFVGCAVAPGEEAGDEQDVTTAAPSADEAKACEEGTVAPDATGAKVLHCTKPFATAPFVRLPADDVAGADASIYGGITVPQTGQQLTVIWTRDGKRYVAVDDANAPVEFGSKLPRALHAPTNRVTFTLYQFKGKLGGEVTTPFGPATAIRLSAARPVVMIDGCAFDGRFTGTWSGTVSERLETPEGSGPRAKAFDETKRIPIHLTLGTMKRGTELQDYSGGRPIPDAATYLLEGTIDNFAEEVTVDGKTYPSLATLGNKNPFLEARDGKVQLYRLGNMHGQPNDGHWVFTYPAGSKALTINGMSYTLTALTAPSMLFGSEISIPELQNITIKPHIPFLSNGNVIVLTPEKVGLQAGQCQ